MTNWNNTIIFDLDGTLADIQKRRSLAIEAGKGGKFHWGVFFNPENIKFDKPNLPVIRAFKAMKAAGYRVGIFSGRDSRTKTETEKWLKEYGIDYDFLWMRPENDYTPDDKLKSDWVDKMTSGGYKIICVYDDRDKVVKMWRDRGIPCFQVNWGDF